MTMQDIKKCWLPFILFLFTFISSCAQSVKEKEIIYVIRDKLNERSCIVVKGDIAESVELSEEDKKAQESIRKIFGSSKKESSFTDSKKKYPEYYALMFNFLLPKSFVIKGLENLPERSPRYMHGFEDHPSIDSTFKVKYFNPPSTESLHVKARLIKARVPIFDEHPAVVTQRSCVDYLELISDRSINVIDTEIWKIENK